MGELQNDIFNSGLSSNNSWDVGCQYLGLESNPHLSSRVQWSSLNKLLPSETRKKQKNESNCERPKQR